GRVGGGDFTIGNVATDSREITDGGLFFALRGAAMDGHRFVPTAFDHGAAAAIVEQPIDQPHVLVDDSFAALQALARAARERSRATIIGVTGSVGKTSVKEAIHAALDRASRGASHRSVKSYNNHVGVPLSLARLPSRARYGVFEMGMNHAGEIAALTAQVRPHVAVITTIAPAHIENLGSEEAIADAKAEIFAGLEPSDEGAQPVAVIPADSPYAARLRAAAEAQGARVLTFGRAADADVRLLDALAVTGGGSLVTAQLGETRLCYTVAAAGDHWVINSLAVMAAVSAAGADLGAAGLALAELAGLAGRGARHEITCADGGRAVLIDESYNANPASMRSTLVMLGQTPARRRIAVLGAMKELGDFAPSLHAGLAAPLAEAGVDFALLVGPEMTALAEELQKAGELGKSSPSALGKPIAFAHCSDAQEALAALAEQGLAGGDALLVKGSNSVGLAALVAALLANQPRS
ncbi:MAG TPA: UDP-N-acetylmuramoyl-tripeptide--D-alanyl-D-alanine ligase, partial [Novosphingobium sp.]|nr:UDP-N-acetylmuramoyl-tripeptide--D-alanyl-D-alanine ligase [Novosphingobium sp.]